MAPVKPSPGFPVLAKTLKAQAFRERFVVEYCKDQNATAAYYRASAGSVTRDTANANGSKLLAETSVREEIERRLHDTIRLAEITPERIKIELARMAFSDPRKLYKRKHVDNPITGERYEVDAPIDVTQLDDDTARAIESIEQKPFGKAIKFASKQGALQTLAKIQGMIVDRKSVSGRVAVVSDEDINPDDEDVIDGELALPMLGTGDADDAADGFDDDED